MKVCRFFKSFFSAYLKLHHKRILWTFKFNLIVDSWLGPLPAESFSKLFVSNSVQTRNDIQQKPMSRIYQFFDSWVRSERQLLKTTLSEGATQCFRMHIQFSTTTVKPIVKESINFSFEISSFRRQQETDVRSLFNAFVHVRSDDNK